MQKLSKLYEAQTVSDISRKLLSGSKTLEYVSKELKNIQGELERWGDGIKMDYIITDNHLYLQITVKGKKQHENSAKARDIALGYKALSTNIKSDTEFNIVWDLY